MGGIVQMQTLTCFRQSVTYTCMIASEHGSIRIEEKGPVRSDKFNF